MVENIYFHSDLGDPEARAMGVCVGVCVCVCVCVGVCVWSSLVRCGITNVVITGASEISQGDHFILKTLGQGMGPDFPSSQVVALLGVCPIDGTCHCVKGYSTQRCL